MPPAMNNACKATLLLAALALGACDRDQAELPPLAEPEHTRVKMQTSLGDIVLRLEDKRMPITVANFLTYVDRDGYKDTLFHRVIPGFMVQGGGFNAKLNLVPVGRPIHNEADRGLRNLRGTIAMARTNAIDSATRQFFINVVDNAHLDHSERSCTREQAQKNAQNCASFGYAAFGVVESGMDVVERIVMQKTGAKGPHPNLPVDDVLILGIERLR